MCIKEIREAVSYAIVAYSSEARRVEDEFSKNYIDAHIKMLEDADTRLKRYAGDTELTEVLIDACLAKGHCLALWDALKLYTDKRVADVESATNFLRGVRGAVTVLRGSIL